MNLLITGGCGFLGSNLAAHAIKKGYKVTVMDNLYREGATSNLTWLKSIGGFEFVYGDIRNRNDVELCIKKGVDVVFHLAGQVAMTTSIQNPRLDFEVNALGTLNVLEAIRKYAPHAGIVYSSTNKVYGDLAQFTCQETPTRYICKEYPKGFDENVQLEFHSPYGCSKGSAEQYMQDYHRIFGLKTVVFRHSSMYGGRQYSTSDQGWIGWFCKQAIETLIHPDREPFTISGNGKQVRDVLFSDDMVRLYFSTLHAISAMAGKAYNIGGGMDNSFSLLELFSALENELGIKLNYEQLPPRESDQKIFVADISKINHDCGWFPEIDKFEGLRRMISWTKDVLKQEKQAIK
jgi:CDP-paratose 2-epimerase